ncbi:FxDxF family PEP-CTERM protein [Duganella callida]|uniref:PEP-CTERM sorting domain-containing protein n=1 Tax=Duganella callida TaxID=2561932 RepID=A0A4Y9SGY2_9BURK|nr:FxDxF family PEP-CTERM protein [Duganella callida]TFW22920.1 PEP-CTERM sorting domain-containing protein [Duganella callida]
MKIKALVAGLLAAASFGASAAGTISAPITTTDFTNVLVGTIHITSASDLTGSVWSALGLQTPGGILSLDSVTFTSATIAGLTDLDSSANGFKFANVAAGYYDIWASGHLNGDGQYSGLAVLGSTYTVTAVPEPETYGMLLGGLAVMGAIARRKAKKAA